MPAVTWVAHACVTFKHHVQGAGEDYTVAFSMQLRQGLPTLYNSTSASLADIAEVLAQPGTERKCLLQMPLHAHAGNREQALCLQSVQG